MAQLFTTEPLTFREAIVFLLCMGPGYALILAALAYIIMRLHGPDRPSEKRKGAGKVREIRRHSWRRLR